jgi:hypothetical protein
MKSLEILLPAVCRGAIKVSFFGALKFPFLPRIRANVSLTAVSGTILLGLEFACHMMRP